MFEVRDGKYGDGEPSTRKEDGTTKSDGFYVAELTDDGHVYGPYPSAARAKIAARNVIILTELERKGRVRREVGKDGSPKFEALESYQAFLMKVLLVISKYEAASTDTIAKVLRKQGEVFADEELELAQKWLAKGSHVRRVVGKDGVPKYKTVKPDPTFLDKILMVAELESTDGIAKVLREQGEVNLTALQTRLIELALEHLADAGHIRPVGWVQ